MKGRKRHILVDTLGLPIASRVKPADTSDRRAGARLLAGLAPLFPRVFKITGLTWIVERSFAWLSRNRRLSKDYEYRVQTSELMVDVAATLLMLNRVTV